MRRSHLLRVSGFREGKWNAGSENPDYCERRCFDAGVAVRGRGAAVASTARPSAATTELVLGMLLLAQKGNLVRDLKREDFTVLEGRTKQQVSSFDFENIDELALAGQTTPTTTGTGTRPPPAARP